MSLSAKEILPIISRRLPEFEPIEAPREVEGGNLNYVWRLKGRKQNIIVKIAPPYIASNSQVPLSPKRIEFEADALQLFRQGNLLFSLASKTVRPPHILFFDPGHHLLAMEDLDDLPHIAQVAGQSNYSEYGRLLGKFIGELHKQSFENSELQKRFNNRDIQQTRLSVQYNTAADYLSKTGLSDVDSNLVSQKTKALGEQLLETGRCLVMGDLWPPSILVDSDNLRLIDWEFCHFGRPLQDIGHFAAHCWMQAHSSAHQGEGKTFKRLWGNFWQEYQKVLGSMFDELIDDQEVNDTATHIGAEVLIRATGPFKTGYVYESYDVGHPLIRQATQKARQLITAEDFSSLWTDL